MNIRKFLSNDEEFSGRNIIIDNEFLKNSINAHDEINSMIEQLMMTKSKIRTIKGVSKT